jgi:hypothetical protein
LNSLKQEEEPVCEIYLKVVIVWERKDQEEGGREGVREGRGEKEEMMVVGCFLLLGERLSSDARSVIQ